LRKKASNNFTDGGGTGVFTERGLELHQRTCHTAEVNAESLITMFQRGMEDQKTRIMALMHEVYWLAKESIATRKFPSLVEHLSATYGLRFGSNYLNKHFAREALKSIAFVLRQTISAWARESTHNALIIDESTDVEQQKVMLVYIRYLEDGVYVTKFWKALWVHKADCNTLTRLIQDHFAEQDVPMATVQAFASDGANVVASTGDGVAGRILAINPWALPRPSGRGWIPWQALTGITRTAGLPVDGKSAEWDMPPPPPARWETGEAGSTWASSQWEAGSVADAHMPTAPGWQTPLR
jgi:hypothetical protein